MYHETILTNTDQSYTLIYIKLFVNGEISNGKSKYINVTCVIYRVRTHIVRTIIFETKYSETRFGIRAATLGIWRAFPHRGSKFFKLPVVNVP